MTGSDAVKKVPLAERKPEPPVLLLLLWPRQENRGRGDKTRKAVWWIG